MKKEKKLHKMNKENKCDCEGNCDCNDSGKDYECDNFEEIEFNLCENEIDEWINELILLKEEKGNIILNIDNDLSLKINYENLEGED
jgi:S-adenosylmethionine hydrolase